MGSTEHLMQPWGRGARWGGGGSVMVPVEEGQPAAQAAYLLRGVNLYTFYILDAKHFY